LVACNTDNLGGINSTGKKVINIQKMFLFAMQPADAHAVSNVTHSW
jgi:hypothetical protein